MNPSKYNSLFFKIVHYQEEGGIGCNTSYGACATKLFMVIINSTLYHAWVLPLSVTFLQV
jgi:hypothetical protein